MRLFAVNQWHFPDSPRSNKPGTTRVCHLPGKQVTTIDQYVCGCVCVIMLLVGQSCGINRRLTTTYITIPSPAPERLLNAILYTLSGGWRAARRLIERIGNNYPAREAGCLRSNKMPVDEACNLTVLVCVWDSLLIYWLTKMSQNNLFFVV